MVIRITWGRLRAGTWSEFERVHLSSERHRRQGSQGAPRSLARPGFGRQGYRLRDEPVGQPGRHGELRAKCPVQRVHGSAPAFSPVVRHLFTRGCHLFTTLLSPFHQSIPGGWLSCCFVRCLRILRALRHELLSHPWPRSPPRGAHVKDHHDPSRSGHEDIQARRQASWSLDRRAGVSLQHVSGFTGPCSPRPSRPELRRRGGGTFSSKTDP